jgi:hypothetical protein
MYRRADSSVARPDGVQAAYQGSITVGDGPGIYPQMQYVRWLSDPMTSVVCRSKVVFFLIECCGGLTPRRSILVKL